MNSNTKRNHIWQVKSRAFALVFALGGFLLGTDSFAQSPEPYFRQWGKSEASQRERGSAPRVALALSGGGARGFAHIGVLRAFEENNIEIAGIAGTSMGAIIGGLYAVGYSIEEIESIAGNLDLSSLFSNSPRRRSLFLTQRETMDQALFTIRFNSLKPTIPTELTTAQQVTEMLSLLTVQQNYQSGQDFTKLKVPFKTVATDMESGKPVTLDHGNLSESLRASMAFPLAISAVEIDGRLLVDGGMTKPAPVDLAQSLLDGSGFVVAVNTTKDLLKRDKIDNAFEVANQVTTIMSRRELKEQLEAADFVITPDVRTDDGVDFSKATELAKFGFDAAQESIAKILAIHDSLSIVKKYSVASYMLAGDRDALEPLLEPLLPSKEFHSEADLDSIFEERWSKGDLLSLTVHSVPMDGGDPESVRLTIAAVKAPKVEDVELDIGFNSEAAPDSVVHQIQEKLFALGELNIDSVQNWLIEICHQRGSDLCRIPRLKYLSATKTIHIEVDDGLAWHLKTHGLKRTRPSFIRDRTHVHAGTPFNIKSAQNAYRDIYGTGLYKRVTVDIAPTDTGATVTVAVEERDNLQLRLGYRWDDEYHNEGFIEALDDHLFGIGLEAHIRSRVAERRKRYSVGLKTDRLFRTFVAFDLQGYISRHDRQLFTPNGDELGIRDEDRVGASLKFSQQIARLGVVSLGSRIESVENFSRPDSLSGDYELRTLTLSSEVEDFDRTYFTQSGRRHVFSAEFAEKILGGTAEFARWQTLIESYFPIKEKLNFYAKIRAAGSSSVLPAPERFYFGGFDSFEGFRNAELSGAKLLLLNLRLRYQLVPRIYLSLGYNTGASYERTDDVTLDNLPQGWVSTLGFDTPFGPIMFGFGRADGGNERVYFNAGLKF